jgi:hypothetical protein
MMIGKKERDFKIHAQISLEDLMPEDNFYRQLEASVSIDFVRDLVEDLYSSIDSPELVTRLS